MQRKTHKSFKSNIPRHRIAYISAKLPSLSETFVYNEIFTVRSLGIDVIPVSVFDTKSDGHSANLQVLANESLVVYSWMGILSALVEICTCPVASFRTVGLAFRDALLGADAKISWRLKNVPKAIASLGIARALRSKGVKHIHAHMANTPTTIAMYVANQLGIGFSFTGHANDILVHRALLSEKLNRSRFTVCISS